MVSKLFGFWTLEKGLIVPQLELSERRRDFKGMKLRGVGLSWDPVTRIVETQQGVVVEGLSNDIMELMQSLLNFQVQDEITSSRNEVISFRLQDNDIKFCQ